MGNRAVITRKPFDTDNVGVYVHWNGGRDSIEAFLKYCQLRGFRAPERDNYGWARLAQVIANFFGGDGLSIGLDKCSQLDYDNGDNGTYLIENWQIVGRQFNRGDEQDRHDMFDSLCSIDEAQPTAQQLGKDKIKELLAK